LKLGQGRLALWPKERRRVPQLGLEHLLQLQPLAETLLDGRTAKQACFYPLDLPPPLAHSAQVTHG
jgi:hypothetical protein